IMAWDEVASLFAGVQSHLEPGGLFCIYGPFNQDGNYTSQSNAVFDVWLKQQGAHQGIRDLEALIELGQAHELHPTHNLEMPANNRLLVFTRLTHD
ncbi:MAG: DUF938 domain-containing protein, partial [Janthinobacterium lividum]